MQKAAIIAAFLMPEI